jgi:hypothetical protein
MNDMNQRSDKIRVGFLLDSLRLTVWEREMVREITSIEGVRVAVVALNGSHEVAGGSRERTFRNLTRTIIYRLYSRIDRALFRTRDDLFQRDDASALFGGSPAVSIMPAKTLHSDHISDDDVRKIQKFEPDVLIRLGFRILRGSVLKAAPLGVWSLHHGDNRVNRGGPPCFWEVFKKVPTTGAVLQILSEDLDSGLVISRILSSTHRWSVNRNKQRLYRKALYLIPDALKEAKRKGIGIFIKEVIERNDSPSFYSCPLYVNPGNLKMAGLLLLHLGRAISTACRKTFQTEEWVLLYRQSDELTTSPRKMNTLLPPKDRFWADPHAVREADRHYIFFEEFFYRKGKGHISLVVVDGKGNMSPPVTVLERPWHLSYPFVLKHENEYFMIPDSGQNMTLDLYRSAEFPFRWEYQRTLLAGLYAADPTVLFHQGRWWLFVSIGRSRDMSACDELHLFHSERLDTDRWSPHPLNPLCSDVTRARPAGSLFMHKGRLYRPSQDCSVSYGYGVRIHEVVKLDPEAYEEREVGHILPDWNKRVTGVHTLTVADGLTMLDARMRFRRFAFTRQTV